ncbi:hypothetical protein RAA17_22825 [Komagataeibacter rhaeticus]|nr:hypothetical protein [Komagataeibacter rhaeticus]
MDGQTLRDGTRVSRVGLADVRFLDGINIGMRPLRRQIMLRLRPDDPAVPVAGIRFQPGSCLRHPPFRPCRAGMMPSGVRGLAGWRVMAARWSA